MRISDWSSDVCSSDRYLSRAPASARLLFLLHCTHRYNPPVCNPRIIMTNFPRIERLPPYVFNITGELKMAARRRGEDIIDMSMGNPDGPTPKHIVDRSEEHTSELQSLMRISYAVFCLKKKQITNT